MSLFRAYVAYRLRNIAVLNGVRVADAERLKGHRMFSDGFSVSPSVGGVPVEAGGQRSSRNGISTRRRSTGRGQGGLGGTSTKATASSSSSSSSAPSSAAAYRQRHATFGVVYTSTLIEQAAEVAKKVQGVDDMWPGLVQRVIKETLEGIIRRKAVIAAAHKRRAGGSGSGKGAGGRGKSGKKGTANVGGKNSGGKTGSSSAARGSGRGGNKKSVSYFA